MVRRFAAVEVPELLSGSKVVRHCGRYSVRYLVLVVWFAMEDCSELPLYLLRGLFKWLYGLLCWWCCGFLRSRWCSLM